MTSIPSEQACGKCHVEIWKEHRENLHARAWVDKVYRMSAGGAKYPQGKLECRSCHSMEPILFDDISSEYGYRPVFRPYNQNDGVGCVSCHLRADGRVAARRTVPGAPCKPVRDPRLLSLDHCGACHNPSHDAVFEFKQSLAYREGKDCRTCHMPAVERIGADGKKKTGYSHVFAGGNDEATVRKAIGIRIGLEGQKVAVRLENRAAHKVPGEVPSRILKIWMKFLDNRDPPGVIREEIRELRRANKGEAGWHDNRLLPDEIRVIREPIPEGTARVHVTVYFQQSPLIARPAWFVLKTWEGPVQ